MLKVWRRRLVIVWCMVMVLGFIIGTAMQSSVVFGLAGLIGGLVMGGIVATVYAEVFRKLRGK